MLPAAVLVRAVDEGAGAGPWTAAGDVFDCAEPEDEDAESAGEPDPLPEGDVEVEYVDDSGNVQGPFSPAAVQAWLDQGFFSREAKVRIVGREWFTMEDLFSL